MIYFEDCHRMVHGQMLLSTVALIRLVEEILHHLWLVQTPRFSP